MKVRTRDFERRLSRGVNVLRGKGVDVESIGWMVFSLAIIVPVVAWVGFGVALWF